MKPEPTTPLHPTIIATADLHIYRTPDDRIICLSCRLRGKRDLWLHVARLAEHIDEHRAAGHETGGWQ